MPDLSPLTRAKHVAELGFLELALRNAGRDDVEVVEPDAADELPSLVVDLGPDDEGRPRTLHVRIIPLDEDEATATRFVEMFVPLPFDVDDDRTADLRQALGIVNEHLAVGHFGLRGDGLLYYRYVLATPLLQMIDDEMFVEVVAFVDFHQDHFADYLEGVCVDEVSLLVLDDVIRQSSV
jgi:hypothetical protein